MQYLYKCEHCEKETVIDKSIYNASQVEFCEICEHELKRVYESPSITTSDGVKQ